MEPHPPDQSMTRVLVALWVAAGLSTGIAAGDDKNVRVPPAHGEDRLDIAVARLKTAQERLAAHEAMVKESEAAAEAATAERTYHEKQRERIARLEKRGAIGHMQAEEEDERLRNVQARERSAKLRIIHDRASLDVVRRWSARPRLAATSPGSSRTAIATPGPRRI